MSRYNQNKYSKHPELTGQQYNLQSMLQDNHLILQEYLERSHQSKIYENKSYQSSLPKQSGPHRRRQRNLKSLRLRRRTKQTSIASVRF